MMIRSLNNIPVAAAIRKYFIFIMLVMYSSGILSQDLKFGIVMGPQLSNSHNLYDSWVNDASKNYLYIGSYKFSIYESMNLGSKTSISLEPSYSRSGFRDNYNINNNVPTISYFFHYASIPLLVNYTFYKDISLITGLEFGYMFKINTRPAFDNSPYFDSYNRLETSYLMGVGYAISDKFCLELRIDHGLNYRHRFTYIDAGNNIGEVKQYNYNLGLLARYNIF